MTKVETVKFSKSRFFFDVDGTEVDADESLGEISLEVNFLIRKSLRERLKRFQMILLQHLLWDSI